MHVRCKCCVRACACVPVCGVCACQSLLVWVVLEIGHQAMSPFIKALQDLLTPLPLLCTHAYIGGISSRNKVATTKSQMIQIPLGGMRGLGYRLHSNGRLPSNHITIQLSWGSEVTHCNCCGTLHCAHFLHTNLPTAGITHHIHLSWAKVHECWRESERELTDSHTHLDRQTTTFIAHQSYTQA